MALLWWLWNDDGEAVENIAALFLLLGLGLAFALTAGAVEANARRFVVSIPGISIGE